MISLPGKPTTKVPAASRDRVVVTVEPGQYQQPVSKTALAGLVFSAAGMCLFPLALVGLVLGIVGLVKTSRDPRLGGKTLSILAICLAPATIVPTGLLAAIAIPNFIRFQTRVKQAECRSTLRTLYAAERSYFLEHGAYSTRIHDLSNVERGNRYAYFADGDGPVSDRSALAERSTPGDTGIDVDRARYATARSLSAADLPPNLGGLVLGISGKCPTCSVTLACIGEINRGPTLDVWSVSTAERSGPDGESIAAGEPYNEVNALTR